MLIINIKLNNMTQKLKLYFKKLKNKKYINNININIKLDNN